MEHPRYSVVIDTNVFVSALRSKRGASYKLLFDTSRTKFDQNVSTPLVLEYESVAKRQLKSLNLTGKDIDVILDMICRLSKRCKIFYLWRPRLKDPKDDMVLELAIESQSDYIITYNKRDFKGLETFGIQLLTPREFLVKIGEIKR
ncbi:MAG: putative toxin-antitoxin system toxin component, PIN family [bacterium]